MEIQNRFFLRELSERTFDGKSAEFKKYEMLAVDFRKVLAIIAKELFFVRPKLSITGYIEGYLVYEVNILTKKKELIFLFGEENLPRGYTLKNLFDEICHSKKNRELLRMLPREKSIKSEFEDYYY